MSRRLLLLFGLLLLFLGSAYATDLNYWIEPDANGNPANVWVKVPYIPASGSTTIYVWKEAGHSPNAAGTMLFWDDFSVNDIGTVWKDTSSSGYYTISNGVLKYTESATYGESASIWVNGVTFPANVIVISRMEVPSGYWATLVARSDQYAMPWQSDTVSQVFTQWSNERDSIYAVEVVNGTQNSQDVAVPDAQTWHIFELIAYDTNITAWRDDGYSISYTANTVTGGGYVGLAARSASYAEWDWVAVAKYAPLSVSVHDYGDYYAVTVENPTGTDLNDFQVPFAASDVNVTSTTESLAVSDQPPSGLAVSLDYTPKEQNQLALDPENNITSITVDYNAVVSKNAVTVTYWRAYDGDTNSTLVEGNSDVNYITFQRVYSSVDDYNTCVTVEAIDDQNQTYEDTACDVVHIDEYPQNLSVSWDMNGLKIPFPSETIEFNGSATDNGTLTYSWDFGDSSTGSGQTTTHAYGSAGTYTVTMTVTDDVGLSKSVTASVPVYAAPTFIMTPNPVIERDPVRFDHSVDARLNYTCSISADGNTIGSCDAVYYPPEVNNGYYRNDTVTVTYTLWDDQNNERNYPVSQTLHVDRMILAECNSDANTTALVATVYDEQNRAELPAIFTISPDLYYKSESNFQRHFGATISDVNQIKLCVYPSYFHPTVTGRIDYSSASYPMRSYLYSDAEFNTLPQDVSLYALANGSGQYFTIYVSYLGQYVQDATVQVLRYYPDMGAYVTVAMGKTDYEGKFVTFVRPADAWYKFIVTYSGITQEFGPTTITGSTTVLTLSSTGGGSFATVTASLQLSCEYVSETNTLKCTYTDPTGAVVSARLEVYRETPISMVLYDSSEVNGPAGSLLSPIDPAYNYKYYFSVYVAGQWHVVRSGYLALSTSKGPYGLEGPVIAALLVVGIAFLGLITPLLAILFALIGLAIAVMLQLVPVGIGSIIGLGVVALIVGYRRSP